MIQILVLLGMYFDAVMVFVASQTLLFRLALAILCQKTPRNPSNNKLGQIIAKKDAGKYGFLEAPLVRQADNELKNR